MKKSKRCVSLKPIMRFLVCLYSLAICRDAQSQSSTVFVAIGVGSSARLTRFDGDQQREVFGGELNTFVSITAFSGELFLGDIAKGQILRVSPTGDLLGVFASPTIPPVFIESDSKGNVYASSYGVIDTPSIRLDWMGNQTQSFS